MRKSAPSPKIGIIGVGNILKRDDGVGVHVVRELSKRRLPPNVECVDAGTAGIDLPTFLEGLDVAVIIDAVRGGGEPGAIYFFSIYDIIGTSKKPRQFVSLHDIGVEDAIDMARKSGVYKLPKKIFVVGIEPSDTKSFGIELTEKVKRAVPKVVVFVVENFYRRTM